MTTVNLWDVEIATVNDATKKTEWRKIGEGLMWYQALEVRRNNKPYLTRCVRANIACSGQAAQPAARR